MAESPVITVPLRFQREGVRLIDHFDGRCILGDDMGLGKSPQALWWMDNFLDRGPVVVLCPAVLKENWRREVEKHTPGWETVVLWGRTPPRHKPPRDRKTIYIVNPDILGGVNSPEVTVKDNTWGNYLKWDIRPRLLISDECHAYTNPLAKRTVALRRLAWEVPHFIAISGTPMLNRAAELWTAIDIIREGSERKWPKSFRTRWRYLVRYCQPTKGLSGWEYRGSVRLDELHRFLRETCLIRRTKDEVLPDLPPKSRYVVPLKLDDYKTYKEASSDILGYLAKNGRGMKNRKAIQITRLTTLRGLAGKLKVQAVIEWVKNFLHESDEKLILFGVHKVVLHAIHHHFRDLSVHIDGDTPKAKRWAYIDRFNEDPTCRLFIGNILAAGQGWSCISASTVAFCELEWRPAMHTQAEDRVRGIARGVAGKASFIYYLVGLDTVEVPMSKGIQMKQRIISEALDGNADMEGFDLWDMVEEELMKAAGYKTGGD